MKKHISILFLFFICVIFASRANEVSPVANYNIIPLPAKIDAKTADGNFSLNDKTVITYPKDNESLLNEARHLQNYIREITGWQLKIENKAKNTNSINLSLGNVVDNPEGYQLSVVPQRIDIISLTSAGVFYGIQTLRKSIPASISGAHHVSFPAVEITDYPRFSYRGAHFDIARHFFPQDSIKKFIDLLALHNINNFHWHLTDDQGWRVEIKKYPRLTEIGSRRPGTVIGRNTGVYDSIPVEGFLTQEQIKDIIQYAADRHINVVPEIDLPGHMVAALTAYPQLGCTGGPYEVWGKWGVSKDLLCAGNDTVYQFIDNVLDEISDLFPSEYIHIGGDECPKDRWVECVKCQAKIEELGLKGDEQSAVEEKLQAYVMNHAIDFLAKKGKKIIGWDEILEGGVSPDATIMSWRGEAGGLKAAGMGHDVIMTPNTYLYFDYYQTQDKDNEPIAMNGYVPLEKVYSYEPIPASFTAEQANRIKGLQANLWTEYIKTFPHAMYMELPRMAALSEVQWSNEEKDYDKFMKRLPAMLEIYQFNGYPYSLRAYEVTGDVGVNTGTHSLMFNLKAPDGAPIYYTLDGTEPTNASNRYTMPVEVAGDTKLLARAYYPFGESFVFQDSVSFNKATARKVELLANPAAKFSREPWILTDGKNGGDHWNSDGWMGFNGTDAVVVIDLEEPTEFSEVGVNTITDTQSHVFDATEFTVSVSEDGTAWQTMATENYPQPEGPTRQINRHAVSFQPTKSRYVKVALKPELNMPDWHPAKGKKAFLFIDEISVN